MNVILIHGLEGSPSENWFGYLKVALEDEDVKTYIPQMPNPEKPDRNKWLSKIEEVVQDNSINLKETLFVGHSLGVPALLDYLSQFNPDTNSVLGLVSVAGFHRKLGASAVDSFIDDVTIDFKNVRQIVNEVIMFYSDNDPYIPIDISAHLAEQLNVEPWVIERGGHINAEAGFTQFPQLKEEILNLR